MKNTNGYMLNAFLDFDTPLDILTHIMIGSEGTLGFIAGAVLHTLPDYPSKYTGSTLLQEFTRCCLCDCADQRVRGARRGDHGPGCAAICRKQSRCPSVLRQLPEGATAILVEYQAMDTDSMIGLKKESAESHQEASSPA